MNLLLDFDAKDTKAAAYHSITDSLPSRRRAVLLAVKAIGPACNRELARYMRVPVTQITGRIFELRQHGLVGRAPGRYVDPDTGKTVARWVVKEEGR